jgi:hypothetical protein
MWPELVLIVGYLVICLISVLTVLLPTTENEEEHAKAKTTTAAPSTTPAK